MDAIKQDMLNEYFELQRNRWAPSTLKSEKSRLESILGEIDGNPERLHTSLKSRCTSTYSIVTTFIRTAHFWDWLLRKAYVSGEENPYKKYQYENARHFKHAYQRQPAKLTFEETINRIKEIKDSGAKNKALQLLQNGLRFTESFTVEKGQVTGKGGKRRRIFGYKSEVDYDRCYSTFRKRLLEVGLKPHDLRKVFATHLAQKGMNVFDLLEVMGWNDLKTAQSYVAANNTEKLSSFIRKNTK